MKLVTRPLFLLLLIILAAGIYRGILLYTHEGFLGVDGGAYFLSRNAVLGNEPTSQGFARPPLAPGWLLVPFTSLWGDDIGFKIWSLVSSLLPIPAVFLFGTRILGNRGALIGALFIAFCPFQSEMFVTGALPLIGFSLLLVALWALFKVADEGQLQLLKLHVLLPLILSIALIPYVNQTAAGISAFILPVAVGIILFGRRYNAIYFGKVPYPLHHERIERLPLRYYWPMLAALTAGTILAFGALPFYISLAPGVGLLRYPGPFLFLTSDLAWFQMLLSVPVGVFIYITAANYAKQFLGVVLVFLGFAILMLSSDETIVNLFYRSRYLIMMFLYPALIYFFTTLDFNWKVSAGAAAAALCRLASGCQFAWARQTEYSIRATPQVVGALRYLEEGGYYKNIITNDFSLGHWIAALTGRQAPHTWTQHPPRAYETQDWKVRCVLGWTYGCDPIREAQDLGASHVLLDERFPFTGRLVERQVEKGYREHLEIYGAPPDPYGTTSEATWLTEVYRDDPVRLYRISHIDAQSPGQKASLIFAE